MSGFGERWNIEDFQPNPPDDFGPKSDIETSEPQLPYSQETGWQVPFEVPNPFLIVTPAFPPSGSAVTNTQSVSVAVFVSTQNGGVVSEIDINGSNSGVTSGIVVVPSGGTVTITYTVQPVWMWVAFS